MSRKVKPPDERRQELLDIGIELFLSKGSSGVSIHNVISRANVATGLFYYYFQSKETFLEEAVMQYATNFSTILAEMLTQNNETALVVMQRAIGMFSVHFKEASPLMHDEIINTPQFHIVMHSILEKLSPIIEQLIEKGVSDCDFHVVSPKITADFILNGLVGMLHSGEHNLSKLELQREIERIVFSALGAYTE